MVFCNYSCFGIFFVGLQPKCCFIFCFGFLQFLQVEKSIALINVLLILLITGSLLIVGEPRRSLLNSSFYLKMALLAVAIMLTAGLQRSISSSPNSWDKDRGRRLAARFAATASIALWCGILFAGRWIAYTQAG